MNTQNRPTLVLVPGFMTDSDLWTDLIPELDGYDCFCADTSTGTTLEAIAAHILEQCPPSFILLGFSLGGYVSRYMCYQAPERVQALIQVGTSAEPGAAFSSPRVGKAEVFRGLSTPAIRRSLGPDSAQDTELIERIRRMGQRLGPDVYDRLSSLERPSEADRLRQIQCDRLVIGAEFDKLRPLDEVRQLAEGLQAELAVIPNCGHMIPLERPKEMASTILEWMERRSA